jgi:hypothetical protein
MGKKILIITPEIRNLAALSEVEGRIDLYNKYADGFLLFFHGALQVYDENLGPLINLVQSALPKNTPFLIRKAFCPEWEEKIRLDYAEPVFLNPHPVFN